MKKMVFSYFSTYEQVESGGEAQQNPYESMGEQALLNEMETHFGEDKNTYGKLQRTSGYKTFFTAVMDKLMKNDPSYPKGGSFSDKVGHYQSTYMDVHQEGNSNFQKPADKMLGPKTRDYMKGWLQAIVDKGSNVAPVTPSIPKPVYSNDTTGISAVRIDSLPKSGSIDLPALKGVSIADKLSQLGIGDDLYTWAKNEAYVNQNGELNLFRSNPYTTTPDKKSITVNFAKGQKITVPLASIVDKTTTGDLMIDEKFKFNGANFTRAVFGEFPKKISEATEKNIGTIDSAFNSAYNLCINVLKQNGTWQEKIDAINGSIKTLEPMQWKVYEITQKQGINTYYTGTLASKVASEMYNKIQGLKLQLEAHTQGKTFFDYRYANVADKQTDDEGNVTRTTKFDGLNEQASNIDLDDSRVSELQSLKDNIDQLNDVYGNIYPMYEAYETALGNANPQAKIDEQFNPERFSDILTSSRQIYDQGVEKHLASSASLQGNI